MDFFSTTGSFLTLSSITLDILDTTELWTWEFWIARSTVMFMMFCEDMLGTEDAGGGGCEEEEGGCGKNGRESGPLSAVICLSISELMC